MKATNFANYSYHKPHKKNCGDASFSGKFFIGEDEYILLFVSDGVSTCTNDYLASHTIKDFLIDYFMRSKEADINNCIKTAIKEINQKLYNGVNGIKGLWATLTLLLHKIDSEEIVFFSSGDTRVYGVTNRSLQQISHDDITSKPYIENGKIKFHEGRPIMYKYVTKSVGFSEQLDIQIQSFSIAKYGTFLIASDGMYGAELFEEIVNEVLGCEDMQSSLNIFSRQLTEFDDDASLAILRLHQNKNIDNIETLMVQDDSIFRFEKKRITEKLLLSYIDKKEEIEINKVLIYLFDKSIFTKVELIEFLEMMIKQKLSYELIEKVKQMIWNGLFYDTENHR